MLPLERHELVSGLLVRIVRPTCDDPDERARRGPP